MQNNEEEYHRLIHMMEITCDEIRPIHPSASSRDASYLDTRAQMHAAIVALYRSTLPKES